MLLTTLQLMAAAASPTYYIYNLTASLSGLDLYNDVTSDESARFQHSGEKLFFEELRRLRPEQEVPPEQAELFFVPVMLVLGFFERRNKRGAMERWSAQVEAAMRAVGPFWDARRSAHVMWSLRCATATSAYRAQWMHVRGWPSLWDSGATLLCSEHASAAERGAIA